MRLRAGGLDRIHAAVARRRQGPGGDDATLFREGVARYDDGTKLILAANDLAGRAAMQPARNILATSVAAIGTGAVGLILGLALLIRTLAVLLFLAGAVGLIALCIYLGMQA